jgi:heme A synthase
VRPHHIAIATVATTLGLMIVGSLVHGTGSSLACPDWPLCHGTAFPEMTGGVRFEHTHRLVAAGVVSLAAVLLVCAWRTEDRVARALATCAFALVGIQATLGGLTVLLRLPPAVSIAHLATSMSFLSVVVLLAARMTPAGSMGVRRPDRREGADADTDGVDPPATGVRPWIGVAALLVFAQIVLGGVVRHTGAALACPDMPLCSGLAWPSARAQWVHMTHRMLGAVAAVATIAGCAVALRRTNRRRSRVVAILPAFAIAAQVALGIALVSTGAPLWLVTLHHATGATTLASLVLAWATIDGRTDCGPTKGVARPGAAGLISVIRPRDSRGYRSG